MEDLRQLFGQYGSVEDAFIPTVLTILAAGP
jgi:hypothetical protein